MVLGTNCHDSGRGRLCFATSTKLDAAALGEYDPSGLVPASPALTVTHYPDGSVASTVENRTATTFTHNADGTVHTQTRLGITETFTYDASGNVTGAAKPWT